MPRFSRVAIRLALLHLLFGFTAGALILLQKGLGVLPQAWALLPAHIESLLLGWTAQLVMGVAFWILPRFSVEPKRGNVTAAWAAVILLNLGIAAVACAGWLPTPQPALLAGRAAQAASGAAFALHAWPRVKPPGA
jgi:hypothetical protein